MAFTIKRVDPAENRTQTDTPDSNLRRVFRFWHRGETQLRPISEIVVQLRLSMLRHNDNCAVHVQKDVLDEILARYLRKQALREQHDRNDMQDMVVVLRLSLMRTLWELRGYLDLPYIDSVIRTTITNFKNKHKQTHIKQEYWGILAEMCWQEIDHARRYEPESETDPVDIDVDDDDIDAWINSEW